jgi:hypothetical protein
MLAIDVDGTLVNSRDELTPRTRDALRQATAAGIRVVIATGRRYRRVLHLVEALRLDAPLVTASGALIKNPSDHVTLFQADFGPRVLLRLLDVVATAGYEAMLYGDTFAEGFDFYCPPIASPGPELAEFFALNPGCQRETERMMTHPPDGVFAGFVMGTRDEMTALAGRLEAALPGSLYLHVLRSPRYRGYMCEIAPQGITKWSGVAHLAKAWGIDPHEICAAGDDVNDIPLIQSAGLGVAMDNADPRVKAAADRIAPAHDEDGLVEVVRWVLE